jgi:hypothetical protein
MPSPDLLSEPAPLRRTSHGKGHGKGHGRGWTLLAVLLGFAVFGAVALVLTDDARWLRLGIVAALWAALVGAFAAARYRREAAGGQERGEELRRVYELELEREVAARREYELQVETDTRRKLAEETRNELDGLRTELHTLRQNLEALLGGEVLVERVALRTESTRLRSLSDQSRAARSADRALPKGTSRPSQPWRSDVPADIQDAEIVEQGQPSPAATPRHESMPLQPPRVEPPRVEPPRVEPLRTEQPRTQPRHAEPAWPERSEPRRVDPAWWERPEPRRTEPARPERVQVWPSRTDDAPPRPLGPSERTDVLPRYQAAARAEPPRVTQAAARYETSQPLDFRPPSRPGPSRSEPRKPEQTATEQPLWPTLNVQPRGSSTPQQRPEPPMADPVYADPLTSPRWDRFTSWAPSQPGLTGPTGPAGPIEAAAAAAAHGHGPGGPSHAEDEHAVQGPTGRRKHAADEGTGSHTTGRSVNELIASLGNDPQEHRRHRRDDE